MTNEEKEFREYCNNELQIIYSKINQEEKEFLSYLVIKFNEVCERNDKAIKCLNKLGTQDGMIKDYKIDKYIKEDLLETLRGNSNG